MANKPLYVVNMGSGIGYYHPDAVWSGVPRDKAKKLTHKDARNVADYLRGTKQGLYTSVEPYKQHK